MSDYKSNPLVSVKELCDYVRCEPGIDDDLLSSLALAATGQCQHFVTREELTVGGTDGGKFPAITEPQFAQIQLWIKAHVAYWYNNRESAGQKLEIQPSVKYLLDSVRTYD